MAMGHHYTDDKVFIILAEEIIQMKFHCNVIPYIYVHE